MIGWLQTLSCWLGGHAQGVHRYSTTFHDGDVFPEVTVEMFTHCTHCGVRVSLCTTTGPDWKRIIHGAAR